MSEQELISIPGPGPSAPIGQPKTIDWTKPVYTMQGLPVHVYAIDHRLQRPVIGSTPNHSGTEREVSQWHYDGLFFQDRSPSCLDLTNERVA